MVDVARAVGSRRFPQRAGLQLVGRDNLLCPRPGLHQRLEPPAVLALLPLQGLDQPPGLASEHRLPLPCRRRQGLRVAPVAGRPGSGNRTVRQTRKGLAAFYG